MYRSTRDVVELLTHENLDVIAAVCQLIEVIVSFDENLKIMINVGVMENLEKLVPTVSALTYTTIQNRPTHTKQSTYVCNIFRYRITQT